jgi:hypothetical protein
MHIAVVVTDLLRPEAGDAWHLRSGLLSFSSVAGLTISQLQDIHSEIGF